MKKSTIWIIAVIMGGSFLALLYLQVKYAQEMVTMKKEQFDESVNRALYQASRNLELNETLRYLEKDVNETERKAFRQDSVAYGSGINSGTVQHSTQFAVAGKDGTIYSSFELKTIATKPSQMPKAMILRNDRNQMTQTSKSLQEIVRNRYVYQKALLDEVVYSILYSASEKPLSERINFKLLDQDLKAELMNNGINIPYHFSVTTQDGREVYRCPDYTEEGEEHSYSQVLFRNDPQQKMGIVHIHFPDMDSYIFSTVRFMIPSGIFATVLLVTFIFTIFIIFRQKKLTEIKNDFINNMTHEFKTPISTISLAGQMLNDETVLKSPTMMKHVSQVITDETKRLRFQVEKVLQMSLFDRGTATIRLKDVDAHAIIDNVVSTYRIKAEKFGGHITADFSAEDSIVNVDEMHFTNVIFNLLDNAIKYRREDVAPELSISTCNIGDEKLEIRISDNGIGMKKEDLKKIFEKFYRVHTGNRHDVKGFGLGLAYVSKMIELFKGTIKAESELNKGTTFIITLPLFK